MDSPLPEIGHICVNRKAFTLIELLAVIMIVGLLVALTLPAVQSARESARRAQCKNNLRQIGLAFQQHLTAKGVFPPARTIDPQCGWTIFLLPYLEMTAEADRYDYDLDFCDPANEPAISSRQPVFECPSNPNPGQLIEVARLGQNPSGVQGAAGDYFVNHLLHNMGLPSGQARRPALLIREFQHVSAILDGLSHTTLVHEQSGRPDYYINGRLETSRYISQAAWGAWGSYQHFQYQGYAADGILPGWDCAINCSNAEGIYSFHPGGANAAFCDGSVQFLAESVEINVVFALATRDGGETVDLEALP